ncbi:hypothetical protein BDY19DRAFT_989980 [Irpex rosettiformis]|uniref:Uncharacterized protein n=1 Tax=Irpex rosettiformis TaxID=378272 RepID=A0ACB8UG50_9APHY|nr:hypothetical protein BDY19DRAFT_989980 [Irpex rosettiformis]
MPLAVIPPPNKLRVLSKLDRASRANMELSKMLYDVRDAFRNLVQAVSAPHDFTYSSSVKGGFPNHRIGRLSSLCAAVLGGHIEEQVQMARAEKEAEDVADNDDLDILQELYEAVPGHYRRDTIIPHALSIIFSTCPRYHTLYVILLEVTTGRGMQAESQAILYHLFQAVLAPVEASCYADEPPLPPIACVSHSNYLKTLRDKVVAAGVVHDRAFSRILCSVLATLPTSIRPEIWTSQAVIRLARRFRSHDYEAFIYLCHQLCEDLTTFSCSVKGKEREVFPRWNVRDRLAKWLELLCERLIASRDAQTHTPCDRVELLAIVELLSTTRASHLHLPTDNTDASKGVADPILCLAVLCLSHPYRLSLPTYSIRPLLAILHDYHGPNIDTFNPITTVSLSYISNAGDPCQLLLLINSMRSSLCRWTLTLRCERLFLLEAWFWSNVLAHLESTSPEISSHSDITSSRGVFVDELEKYRKEVVKKIEEAERMHFAGGRSIVSGVDQTPSKTLSKAQGAEFRWEELVGCWVLKTPLPANPHRSSKRSYTFEESNVEEQGEDMNTLKEHTAKQPRILATPLRRRAPSIPRSTSQSSSSYVSSRASTTPTRSSSMTTPFGESENSDVEVTSAQVEQNTKKTRTTRRRSAFASVLADANSNRVVLHRTLARHPESDKHYKVLTPFALSPKDLPFRVSPKPAVHTPSRDDLSSDDLNLFAYHSSER